MTISTMDRWMRRRGSRYGQWHYAAEPPDGRFARPRAVVAACGLILGRIEIELEHSDDPSDYAARCTVCRALGPIPLVSR
jgi:hypothetical protein